MYQKEFEHPVWRRYLQEGVDQAGHGGTDLLELRDFVRCVRHRLPVSIDVYDSAAWSVISPLSEQSVALGGQPMSFPDFTNGRWMVEKPDFGLWEAL